MKLLQVDQSNVRYTGIIGTGGIGSGKSFVLNGDHTLGREESRSGHFLDVRDYCKQHIILHYIKILLGPSFVVIPVGKVGQDDLGNALFQEMTDTGFIMDHVEKTGEFSTLFSLCFHYPDGSGGNLTTDNSASASVDAAYIEKAADDIKKIGPKGIVMAAPEVPLSARERLLQLGKKYQAFCTASFTSEEIQSVLSSGMMDNVDLLAINLDEAAALTGKSSTRSDALQIAEGVAQKLKAHNKNMLVSITAGSDGSWCWDTEKLHYYPAPKVSIKSTAGAGDAFFSGLLIGMATGHSLSESQQLATLLGGLSVTSPHTIHPGIDRASLYNFLQETNSKCSEKIINTLKP